MLGIILLIIPYCFAESNVINLHLGSVADKNSASIRRLESHESNVAYKIGDKTAELTTLNKLNPLVGSAIMRDHKKNSSSQKRKKEIELTPLYEINSVVYGGIPIEKHKKSNLVRIRKIIRSIIK